jgi:hypothetical protein
MSSHPRFLFASHDAGYLANCRFDFSGSFTTIMGPRGAGP